MISRKKVTMMGLSTLILAATQVDAQNRNCGPHASVIAYLAENYAESRRMIGLAANNAVVEVLVADSGTWTILVTTPGGPTCLVASGTDMEQTAANLNRDPDA